MQGAIVGGERVGQQSIIKALSEKGLPAIAVNVAWPRDHYVYFNGIYVKSGAPGFIQGNPFGEGGKILSGDDFLLVSDMAYIYDSMRIRLPQYPTFEQVAKVVEREGKLLFPSARIHVAPTGYLHEGLDHGNNSHIDMFSMLLPRQKLLLLDSHFGKKIAFAREYDSIAEQEGLRIVRYDGSQDGVWYPLNSPVFPFNDGEIAVIDKNAKSLERLLRDKGVEVAMAELPNHPYPSGKARCQINTYDLNDGFETVQRLLA